MFHFNRTPNKQVNLNPKQLAILKSFANGSIAFIPDIAVEANLQREDVIKELQDLTARKIVKPHSPSSVDIKLTRQGINLARQVGKGLDSISLKYR